MRSSGEGAPLAQGVAATRAALERGAEVVFQGALAGGAWGGWSDFLERVERPSALGAWSYEVADTKLQRKPQLKHVLQLALSSDLLAEVQGVAPEHAHVELGDGRRETIRLAEVSAYSGACAGGLRLCRGTGGEPGPVLCAECPLCCWREAAEPARLAEEDSLCRVANVTPRAGGEAGGCGRRHDGPSPRRGASRARGMASQTLARLVMQSRSRWGAGDRGAGV